MSLKQKIKLMLENNNWFLRFCSKLYNHLPFNNVFRLHRNRCTIKSACLKKCKILIKGSGNTIYIDNGCILKGCKVQVVGNNNTIKLGKAITGIGAEFYIEDDGNCISVDEHTSFSGKIHMASIEGSKITIGRDCLFSSEITLRTGDSHSILDMNGDRINPSLDIVISDHVWVGHRVTINKGARIGSNCMIGTGAIVTKAFDENNAIIAGVPAKVIKNNINWCSKRI